MGFSCFIIRSSILKEEFGTLEERIGQCKSDKKFYERKKAELMAKIEEVRKKVKKIDDEYQVITPQYSQV